MFCFGHIDPLNWRSESWWGTAERLYRECWRWWHSL